jgi:hypothetical protein
MGAPPRDRWGQALTGQNRREKSNYVKDGLESHPNLKERGHDAPCNLDMQNVFLSHLLA